ncbi:MAG: DUF814 domain-containing protein [Deltaproteobacteria bacterium]|nr:MAG: DUF814 domain-containing protein [Deltaproteobacteria bacterium]
MDAFVLKKVVQEVRERLTGALVSKVHQPGKREIVIDFWKPGVTAKLLISTHPTLSTLHLTEGTLPNPPSPPRFCQSLRKHLSGARLTSIEEKDFDRHVRLGFGRKDAEGEISLICELYGRHGNIILVSPDGTVINALALVTAEETRVREVLPGIPYTPLPPLPKRPLPEVDLSLCEEIFAESWDRLSRTLLEKVHGLSKEICSLIEGASPSTPEELCEILSLLADSYRKGDYRVGLSREGKWPRLAALPPFLPQPAGFEEFPSPSRAADVFFLTRYLGEQFQSSKSNLIQAIRKRLNKARRRLENVMSDVAKLEKFEEQGKYGELLKGALHSIRRGQKEVTVLDYSTDPPSEVTIPLDPALSPVENMYRFFRLYRKGRDGLAIKEKIISSVKDEIEYLESALYHAEHAGSEEEVAEIREELEESGYLRTPKKKKRRGRGKEKPLRPPSVEKLDLSGHVLYVGKSNRGNDHIIRHLAKPGDLWFHAVGYPGSHVVLKRSGPGSPPEEIIEEAARIAASRSAARGDTRVQVFVADARDVIRVPGKKPGLVRVRKYRTVVVETGDM